MTAGKKVTAARRTSENWCSECGFRVRGDNHKKGMHHIIASARHKETGARIGPPGRTGDTTRRRHGMQ